MAPGNQSTEFGTAKDILLGVGLVALKRAGWVCLAVAPCRDWKELSSEAVEGLSLPLESVDDIHGGHSLPLGVLSVGDGVPDHILHLLISFSKFPVVIF